LKEVAKLREARRELKEFENSDFAEMPSHFKLKEFRKLARDVIEGGVDHKARSGRIDRRTTFEEERLREKVKDLEEKYPHVDFTQIFMGEKADAAQKALHKSAFASYKAYEFLKHGVKTEAAEPEHKSAAKQRLEENDPYNFPELDASVAKVISSDITMPHMLDHGEPLNKSGRRYSTMTDTEFIESYFGKDLMRDAVVDRHDDPLYIEQKSLKERYPISQFLKMPTVDRKKKQLKDLGIHPDYKSIDFNNHGSITVRAADPEFARVQE